MTNLRLLTPSAAFALGAALLVTTALHSTPAEAQSRAVKTGGHKADSALKPSGKQPSSGTKQPGGGLIPVGSSIPLTPTGGIKATSSGGGKNAANSSSTTQSGGGGLIPVGSSIPLTPTGGIKATSSGGGKNATSSSSTTQSGGGGLTPVGSSSIPLTPTGGKQPPVITGTSTLIPPIIASNFPGGGKQPPVITGTPIPVPIPPVTGPINPGNYPGGSRPPVIVATPIPVPIPPTTGSLPNPGNYPGTPPISTVPIPTPIPVPIPTGSSHNPGYGTGIGNAHQYGQHGVYADIGAGGESYEACRLFKSNYDRTGNAYWLNRYRVCLWQR